MPQFGVYLRNALQWGFRQVSAVGPDAALEGARRLIKDDPAGFEMFYDGEFCDTVTQIQVSAAGSNDELAAWVGRYPKWRSYCRPRSLRK